MEMLKRPEASEIKESGRFYLQVGNDELFELGQSAWAGAKYIPTNRVIKKVNDSIDFINNDGTIVKSINNQIQLTDSNNYGEQLPNIVKYLYDLAIKENIKFKSLWLPSIPEDIYLSDIAKKYNYEVTPYEIEPIIGEYDKPANQFQGLYKLNLNCDNTIVFGIPGSGKENLLSNIIYSSCISHTPNEVNFYILDFGSEVLHVFNKMPHVGDFITSLEKKKVMAQFEFLENEIRRRKDLFSNYSGNYSQYCKESGDKVPLIVTILNAYEGFMENCGDYDDYLVHLLREGSKYGVVFVVSAVSTNSVRSNVLEYFNNKIILQTADPFDYQYILGAEQGTAPLKTIGRGLTIIDEEATEFQTANITFIEKINETISNTSKVLLEKYNYKVPEIRVMPQVVKLDRLFRYTRGIDRIPVGYSRDRVELVYYDFMHNKNSLIVGPKVIDNMTFMGGIIDLIDSIKGIKLNVIDIITCIETDGEMSYYNVDFMEPFVEILDDNSPEPTVNIFLGIGDYKNNLNEDEIEAFNTIMNNLNTFKNQTFIFIDNYNSIMKILDELWFDNINKLSGIWVGNDIDMQAVFKLDNLNTYDTEETLKDIVYVISNNKYDIVKGIGTEEEDLF
jgi:S-DNA-T family DNA segregation ATPase FtsK/SpoIIIE